MPHQLDLPVLAAYGDKDAYCLEGQMLASAQLVAEACWQYERLNGVGHWLPTEAADTVNRLLLAFLQSKP